MRVYKNQMTITECTGAICGLMLARGYFFGGAEERKLKYPGKLPVAFKRVIIGVIE